jgi:hypothetical protein
MSDGKKPAAPPPMKAFKISDAVKKPVERPRAGAKSAAAPVAASSAGFPRIEALVESTEPDLSGLLERQALLADMAKSSKVQKEKLGAQRAAKAYEKARALLERLFQTKQQMGQKGP